MTNSTQTLTQANTKIKHTIKHKISPNRDDGHLHSFYLRYVGPRNLRTLYQYYSTASG